MTRYEIADGIAKKISLVENVDTAYVDDFKSYSDYTDFQVVAVLKLNKTNGFGRYWPDTDYNKFSLRKTSAAIRKILNTDKSVLRIGKNVECPERLYSWNGNKNEFDGYKKNYIMVDFMIGL